MSGAFEAAALDLHAHGLIVIPTGGSDGKSPLVGGWNHWKGQRRQTVEAFARKHPDANIGILTGRSLTVVDADDERTLADAEARFGRSPIVTRSPRGGGHLYYRSRGERNANLRSTGMNADVRGIGGLVLAPPSVRPGVGSYRLERGSWDELGRLPKLPRDAMPRPAAVPASQEAMPKAAEGSRNSSLFTALRYHAEASESEIELVAEAHAINAQFSPPLAMAEAEKVARSVWRLKVAGRIIIPGMPRVLSTFVELETLSADAFYLLGWLKRWHGGRQTSFALSAKAMERAEVLQGWGRRRYELAILELRKSGRLVRIHKGGARRGDPSLFRMGARNTPNVTDTPPPPPKGGKEQ